MAEKLWSGIGANSSDDCSKFSRPRGLSCLDEPIRKRDLKAQAKKPISKFASVPVEEHSKAAKYEDMLQEHEIPNLSVPFSPLRGNTKNGKRFFNSLLAKA